MTAAVFKFTLGQSGRQPVGPNPPSLYRHHDFCAECFGHHAIELPPEMAKYLRAIAPQTEDLWADCEPELIHGCRPLPRSAIKKNTLILTGEAVANIAESLETAYHALLLCVRRLRNEHRPGAWIKEVEQDVNRVEEAMRLFFQYHLDEIDPSYLGPGPDKADPH